MASDRLRLQVRNVVVGGLAGLMVATGAGGGAWACVPQARLVSLEPRSSGAAGSEVTVKAVAFDPGPAEVRWNASDGPRLATAVGPDFSVAITIPDAEEGLHAVVVLSRAPNGALGNASSAPFQVTGSGGSQSTGGIAAPSGGSSVAEPASGPSWLLLAVIAGTAAGALLALGCLLGVSWTRRRSTGSSGHPRP